MKTLRRGSSSSHYMYLVKMYDMNLKLTTCVKKTFNFQPWRFRVFFTIIDIMIWYVIVANLTKWKKFLNNCTKEVAGGFLLPCLDRRHTGTWPLVFPDASKMFTFSAHQLLKPVGLKSVDCVWYNVCWWWVKSIGLSTLTNYLIIVFYHCGPCVIYESFLEKSLLCCFTLSQHSFQAKCRFVSPLAS